MFYGVVVALVSGIITGSVAVVIGGSGAGAGSTVVGVDVAVGSVDVEVVGVEVEVVGVVVEVVGVVVAAPGMVSDIKVPPVSDTEEVAVPLDASPAGSTTASVPAFVVAPQAPSDVFITPPSIYIHLGAPVCLSYIVTPLAIPPPTVSFWVSTLCAVMLPPSSIFHKPPSPEILLTFNNEKPFTFKSLLRDTVSAVISAKLPVPPLAASWGWPRLTKTRTLPVWENVATPSESVVQPSNGSRAMPTVAAVAVAVDFIPTPAKADEIVILSPTAIDPFSKEILTGTRPARATG